MKAHYLNKVAVLLTILTLTITGSGALGAHRMGNGGDTVRANFIRLGQAVLAYLNETDSGRQLVMAHQLDLNALARVLDIEVVKAVDGILIDNGGSVVDAIGEFGRIDLATDRWVEHFENDRDVYFLVFHEMLRALAINDDNYLISSALNPFPYNRRIITRLASVYPVLGQTALSEIIDVSRIVFAGTGCPNQLRGTDVDFDEEHSNVSLAFRRFDIRVSADGPQSGRKACTLIVPITAPVGSRVVLTQLDYSSRVELAAGATASISSDAVLDDLTAQSLMTKSFTASSQQRGRLLIRSNPVMTRTGCDGVGKLLRVRAAATLTLDSSVRTGAAILLADRVGLSLRVESCTP